MNSFENQSEEALNKFMYYDWANVLSKYITIHDITQLSNLIKRAREQGTVYPDSQDVFKAFWESYSNIKIVIIGQDPYFNGNADGLAFSCKKNLSPSLKQIHNAIKEDLKTDSVFTTYNLEYLAKQGVFLFNPTLTVAQGMPNSHKAIWRNFSQAVFKALSKKKNLVWMMWGRSAKDSIHETFNASILGHLMLINEHPAAAARDNRTWKCNHFTHANRYLKERGMEEIKWLK